MLVVETDQPLGTTMISANSWADPLVPRLLFRFPSDWQNPPRLFTLAPDWTSRIEPAPDGGWQWRVPAATWDEHTEPLPSGQRDRAALSGWPAGAARRAAVGGRRQHSAEGTDRCRRLAARATLPTARRRLTRRAATIALAIRNEELQHGRIFDPDAIALMRDSLRPIALPWVDGRRRGAAARHPLADGGPGDRRVRGAPGGLRLAAGGGGAGGARGTAGRC